VAEKGRAAVGLVCPHGCLAKISTAESLKRHLKYVHGPFADRLKCPHCEFKTSRQEHLRNHIRNVHINGGVREFLLNLSFNGEETDHYILLDCRCHVSL
jgi:hypothetical protein